MIDPRMRAIIREMKPFEDAYEPTLDPWTEDRVSELVDGTEADRIIRGDTHVDPEVERITRGDASNPDSEVERISRL